MTATKMMIIPLSPLSFPPANVCTKPTLRSLHGLSELASHRVRRCRPHKGLSSYSDVKSVMYVKFAPRHSMFFLLNFFWQEKSLCLSKALVRLSNFLWVGLACCCCNFVSGLSVLASISQCNSNKVAQLLALEGVVIWLEVLSFEL